MDNCLQLIQELSVVSSNIPVLFAVDDYNALYWKTEYGESVVKPGGRHMYRRELQVDELNLVSYCNDVLFHGRCLALDAICIVTAADREIIYASCLPAFIRWTSLSGMHGSVGRVHAALCSS